MKNLFALIAIFFSVFFIACEKDSLSTDETLTIQAVDSSPEVDARAEDNTLSKRCLLSSCSVNCEDGTRPYAYCKWGSARCGCRKPGVANSGGGVELEHSYEETIGMIGALEGYLVENDFNNPEEVITLYYESVEFLNGGDIDAYYMTIDHLDAVMEARTESDMQLLIDWFGE